jgi:hypothetical protein
MWIKRVTHISSKPNLIKRKKKANDILIIQAKDFWKEVTSAMNRQGNVEIPLLFDQNQVLGLGLDRNRFRKSVQTELAVFSLGPGLAGTWANNQIFFETIFRGVVKLWCVFSFQVCEACFCNERKQTFR